MTAVTKMLKQSSPRTGTWMGKSTSGGKARKCGSAEWSERDHQEAFFRWVDGKIADGKTHYITLGAIPNGNGQVSKVTLAGYKTLGFRVGMPDIYWYLARGKYHGLFLELKTMKHGSQPTGTQYLMGRVLKKHGYLVEYCHGYESAITAVERYDRMGESHGL